MKKSLLVLSLLTLSTNAFAVIDGAPADWSKHDDLVQMQCTGTIIAGKWVLTAGHCGEPKMVPQIEPSEPFNVDFENGHSQMAKIHRHPGYLNVDAAIDIALWELPKMADTTTATFLSMRTIGAGETIRLNGFGAGFKSPLHDLATATYISNAPYSAYWDVDLKFTNQGYAVGGDSGAPYLDSDNKIVGIESGIGTSDYGEAGTRLTYARDFILDHVNGWHYQTQYKTPATGGDVTVQVQSLHKNDFIDNATTTGDLTITGGTCLGATVKPFDMCTYVVSSNGEEGKLVLDDNQVVTVNKSVKKAAPVKAKSEKKDSGGAMSFPFIMSALGLALGRRRKLALSNKK